jgi:hypothetical protein
MRRFALFVLLAVALPSASAQSVADQLETAKQAYQKSNYELARR